MSRREPKAVEWLTQQIEELGTLRNASVRDPGFKAWRQNTLTFIQRIWPGQTSTSERFRRIPFTPPSTKHDPKGARESYERGCGEALEFLSQLRASLGSPAVEAAGEAAPDARLETFDGDFPTVDLAAGDKPPAPKPVASGNRSQGPPSLPPTVAGGRTPTRDTGEREADADGETPPQDWRPLSSIPPAPPTPPAPPAPPAPPEAKSPNEPGRVVSRGEVVRRKSDGPQADPLKDILRPMPSRRAGQRPARTRGNGKRARPRLKDMLGFSDLETRGNPTRSTQPREVYRPRPTEAKTPPSAPPAPVAPPPPVESVAPPAPPPPPPPLPPPPPPPVARVEPPAPPVVVAPPPPVVVIPPAAPRASEPGWVLPEFAAPAEPVLPLTAHDVEPAVPVAPVKPSSESASSRLEPPGHERFGEPPVPPKAAAPAALPPAPPAPPEASDDEGGDDGGVTEEFMRTSPVLSSMARPVQRKAPEPAAGTAGAPPIPARGSVASQLLAIASEVDRLGVPDGHRARARAALMDLARQVDAQELNWELLREALHFLMEYPPLARRAVPLLLPFLDTAA